MRAAARTFDVRAAARTFLCNSLSGDSVGRFFGKRFFEENGLFFKIQKKLCFGWTGGADRRAVFVGPETLLGHHRTSGVGPGKWGALKVRAVARIVLSFFVSKNTFWRVRRIALGRPKCDFGSLGHPGLGIGP